VIAWSQFRPGFAALLTRLGGVPPHVAKARDDGFDFTFPAGAPVREDGSDDDGQVSLDFSIVSERIYGSYEERRTYDEDAEIEGDEYEPDPDDEDARLGGVAYAVNANSDVTIEITCDRFNQSAPAYETLARIRDRLFLPSSKDALALLGIAVRDAGPVRRVDAEIDGRALSRYVFEIGCNAMANATDDPITTIEHATLDTTEILP
jgi:hypothetical protein